MNIFYGTCRYSPVLWDLVLSSACAFPPLVADRALWLPSPSVTVQLDARLTHSHSRAAHHTPAQPHRVSAGPRYTHTQKLHTEISKDQ